MVFPFLVVLPGLIAISLPAQRPGLLPSAHGVDAMQGEMTIAGRGLIPPKINETTGQPMLDANGKPLLDYDLAVPNMLVHYLPTGLLGLGITALLASFMSGMAGNVTAFNTVWTYDIYQAYIHRGATDQHYLWVGRMATVFGIALSVAAAYAATRFNNIMDFLQLVFAFVNAPLFATFLLGMFWKRTTGHAAFGGLLSGTVAAAIHHGRDPPCGSGGWDQGWLASDCPRLSQRNGPELLDGHLGMVCLYGGHHSNQSGNPASQRRGTRWTRLFFDPADFRRSFTVVQEAGSISDCRPRVGVDTQHYFLVGAAMGLDIRLPIGLLFSVIGLLLVGFGAFGDNAHLPALAWPQRESGLGGGITGLRADHAATRKAVECDSSPRGIAPRRRAPRG